VEARADAPGAASDSHLLISIDGRTLTLPLEVGYYFFSNFESADLGAATDHVFAQLIARILRQDANLANVLVKLSQRSDDIDSMNELVARALRISFLTTYSTMVQDQPQFFLWERGLIKRVMFDSEFAAPALYKMFSPANAQGLNALETQEVFTAFAALYDRALETGADLIGRNREHMADRLVMSKWFLNKGMALFNEERLGRYIIAPVRFYGSSQIFNGLGVEDPLESIRIQMDGQYFEPGIGKTQRLLVIDLRARQVYHFGYNELAVARYAFPKLPKSAQKVIERSLTETRLSDRSWQPIDDVLRSVVELRLNQSEWPFDMSSTYLNDSILQGLFR